MDVGFRRKRTETPTVDELLAMKDSDLRKVIASGEVPQKSPAELRKAAAELKRRTRGEIGLGALVDAARDVTRGAGRDNYLNIPLKQRVHPAEYERILEREAKRQGLI